MNNRQAREFATIVNSRTFLRTHNLDTGPFAAVARTLDDVIRRVQQAAPSTVVPTRGAPGRLIRTRVTALRREHMIPISRRGKVIFRGEPRIETVLRVPHARSQPGVIVAAAKRMIERLTPHKKLFVAEGFAPGFLTELRTATKQLADAIKAGDRLGAQAPAAYLELKRQIARGRAEVGVADGIMLGWLERQTPSIRSMRAAQWRQSHRITARIGRPKKPSTLGTTIGATQST